MSGAKVVVSFTDTKFFREWCNAVMHLVEAVEEESVLVTDEMKERAEEVRLLILGDKEL